MAAIDPTAPAMHSGSAMASEAIGKAMCRNGNQAHSASTSTVQAVAPSTSPVASAIGNQPKPRADRTSANMAVQCQSPDGTIASPR